MAKLRNLFDQFSFRFSLGCLRNAEQITDMLQITTYAGKSAPMAIIFQDGLGFYFFSKPLHHGKEEIAFVARYLVISGMGSQLGISTIHVCSGLLGCAAIPAPASFSRTPGFQRDAAHTLEVNLA